MAEFSTNLLLDGVTLALRAAFPTAHIEAESVEQGLALPAFLVYPAETSQKAYPGGRWQRSVLVELLYLPRERDPENPETGGRWECAAVGDALFEVLETIALPDGDLVRGTGLRFSLIDGVLHFFAEYTRFVTRTREAIAMESLETALTSTEQEGLDHG